MRRTDVCPFGVGGFSTGLRGYESRRCIANVLDAIFAGLLALLVACRWVERRSGSATTARGERATTQDFQQYLRSVLLVATLIWVAANFLGNHVLH